MTRFALILAAVVAVAHADPIVWTGDPTSFWDEAEDRSAGALATDTGMIIGATCNATDLNGCFLEFTADRLFTVTSTDSFRSEERRVGKECRSTWWHGTH